MSDDELPPTHQPWGAEPGPEPPPNPYTQPGSFDQYAAPTPYAASPYGPYPGGPATLAPEHPSANTGLVLGIIGLVGLLTCGGLTLVLSPFAWVISGRALRDIDASPGRYSGREKVSAGRIMGMVGTALLALGVLAIAALIVLAVAITPSSSDNGPHPPQVHHRAVSS